MVRECASEEWTCTDANELMNKSLEWKKIEGQCINKRLHPFKPETLSMSMNSMNLYLGDCKNKNMLNNVVIIAIIL